MCIVMFVMRSWYHHIWSARVFSVWLVETPLTLYWSCLASPLNTVWTVELMLRVVQRPLVASITDNGDHNCENWTLLNVLFIEINWNNFSSSLLLVPHCSMIPCILYGNHNVIVLSCWLVSSTLSATVRSVTSLQHIIMSTKDSISHNPSHILIPTPSLKLELDPKWLHRLQKNLNYVTLASHARPSGEILTTCWVTSPIS